MATSVPGLREDEIAHLSEGQRKKLAAERSQGARAIGRFAEEAKKTDKAERAAAKRQARTGRPDPNIDLTAQRVADAKLAEARAKEAQEAAIKVNHDKEVQDQLESIHGRKAVPPHIAEHVADAAQELVNARATNATEQGQTPESGVVGHPDQNPAQAEAALANATKEIADRSTSGLADGSTSTFQGINTDLNVRVPVLDGVGNHIGEVADGKFEPNENFDPNDETDNEHVKRYIAENGQANNPGDTPASAVVMDALDGDGPKRSKRNRGGTSPTKAVGDGPSSE